MSIKETGWMIEATKGQQEMFGLNGPAWWTGEDPNIHEYFSTDPCDGVRFARREDAEKVILGWGYSLNNPWVFATDHRWG